MWCWVAFLLLIAGPCGARPAAHPPTRDTIEYGADPLYQRMAAFVLPLGYKLEQRFVTTPDGYILRLFRIPPRSSQVEDGILDGASKVVYMQHALLDSSIDYVFLGPGKGLAFMLLDEGYDVWLGNIRGNTFSRNHSRLNPDKDAQFWQFSYDEHALVDLPAMVDTMLAVTQAPRFAYVGYSQGTIMAFAALSSLPHLAARVSVAALMAPIAFITHSTALGVQLAAHADTDKIYQLLGIGEWLGHSSVLSLLLGSVCRLEPTPCILAMGAIGGFNPGNIDPKLLPLIFQYLPAGTSVQNAAHWSQGVRNSNESVLQRYDFGSECQNPLTLEPQRCNQQAYGQATPPVYNLSAITTKLALFTGGEDSLADPRDISLLLAALPPGSVVHLHNEPSYSHWDFGFGSDVHDKVFPQVLQVIAQQHLQQQQEQQQQEQ